jgi:hypothetical protein
VANVAEGAAAGADVAEDHEGGSPAAKTLTDIRAGGFLADGMQLAFAQHGFDFTKASGTVAGLDANPVRFAQGFVDGNDFDRNARRLKFALLFDALLFGDGFSHVMVPVAVANVGKVARPPRER